MRFVVMLALVASAAACARNTQEEIVVQPEPISVEPVQTGKF